MVPIMTQPVNAAYVLSL